VHVPPPYFSRVTPVGTDLMVNVDESTAQFMREFTAK